MKTKLLVSVMAVSLGVAGCANMDDKSLSTAVGAGVGCVGGALVAKLAGKKMAAGCIAGAVVGGLAGFAKARQDEIDAAEKAKQEAIAAFPASSGVSAGEVKTIEVTATDKATKEVKKFQAFESVSIDIPLSTKGTPEYQAAMGKIKTLAEKIADERGASSIEIVVTPADAKRHKIALRSDSVKTEAGNTVTVTKEADKNTPKSIEHITVRAGNIKNPEV